ncbi:MAG: Cof-type HAD-IIB family hydrolase [Oliverpabstia sp.]
MDRSKIRMIGLDLDGTVFNDAKIITPHTKEVLAEAIRQGVVVLPATGRPECGLPEEFLKIPGVKYAVTSNGARVIEIPSGKTVYQQMIPCDVAVRLIRLVRQWENCAWEVYFDGQIFVEEGEYRFLNHPDMTPALKEYMYRSRVPYKNLFHEIVQKNIDLEKMHMVFEDTAHRNRRMIEIREQFPELEVSNATTFNIEINSIKAGKGTGLLELGKILGISREEIMACGDATNDWNMLKAAGFPVVMANADEETKKLAAFVTRSNEEDGVAYAIERYVLKK